MLLFSFYTDFIIYSIYLSIYLILVLQLKHIYILARFSYNSYILFYFSFILINKLPN